MTRMTRMTRMTQIKSNLICIIRVHPRLIRISKRSALTNINLPKPGFHLLLAVSWIAGVCWRG
jgi:hypothetical protein